MGRRIHHEVVKNIDATLIKNYLNLRREGGIEFVRKGHLVRNRRIGHKRAILELSCIGSLCQELFMEGSIGADEIRRISLVKVTRRGKPKEPRAVSLADYEAVLEHIRPRNEKDILRALRDRAIVILALRYWLRKSEPQNLKVETLKTCLVRDNGEIGKAYILEWTDKGNKERTVWLTPEAAEPLLLWLKESGLENRDPDTYMFPRLYRSGKFRYDKSDPNQLAKCISIDACIEARFDDLYRAKGLVRPGERSYIILRSLRRGGIRAAKEGGANICDMNWDAGHAEVSTTADYLGQRGFAVSHSSQYIKTTEVKTADSLERARERVPQKKREERSEDGQRPARWPWRGSAEALWGTRSDKRSILRPSMTGGVRRRRED